MGIRSMTLSQLVSPSDLDQHRLGGVKQAALVVTTSESVMVTTSGSAKESATSTAGG
jgi:hypothetical protein